MNEETRKLYIKICELIHFTDVCYSSLLSVSSSDSLRYYFDEHQHPYEYIKDILQDCLDMIDPKPNGTMQIKFDL
jgi:hypothetical protein